MTTKRTHWTGDFAMQRRPLLLMRAKNVCRNPSDAEDLVQETMIRFIQSFGSVAMPPEARLCEAWMMRVVNNLFIDQCRKRKVQELGAKEPSLNNELATQEPVGDSVFDEITPEQIAEALDNLSPKLRETFKLHLSGKKYHEIAELLSIPMGTVAKRMHDARAKLHELLKRPSPPSGDLS
jgi:RNA polymerase sigma-70 factor (ECF subfamily)